MNCDEALLAISAALDGELTPAEQGKLSEHLLCCPECRELAEDLRVLSELLEDSAAEPPAELAASIQKAVAEEPQTAPAPKKRRAPYLRAVAAMLALCIGLGGLGLFAAGKSAQKSADSGAANMAPALFGAVRQAPEGAGREGCDEAESEITGYSSDEVTADGAAEPPAEMENGDCSLPKEAPVPEPAALAPSEPADVSSGKQEVRSVPGDLWGDNAMAPPPDAVITFESRPEGWEELFPGVASIDAIQVPAEEARAFLRLLEEQEIPYEIELSDAAEQLGLTEDSLYQLLFADVVPADEDSPEAAEFPESTTP